MKPEDVLRHAREAQSTALAVKATFLLSLSPSTIVPALWLDVSNRPDVEDLTRIHRSEGGGDIQTFWLYTAPAFYLHCELKRPVTAAFWIRFPLPEQEGFLNLVSSLGLLSFITSPPPSWLLSSENGNDSTPANIQMALLEGVTVNTLHDELSVMLARWRTL